MLSGYLTLLRQNRNYRLLWLAQIVSELGDWFYTLAVYNLLLDLTGSKAQAVGLAVVLQVLPSTFAAPTAGVLNDRISRKRIMIGADLVRFFIVLGMLLVRTPSMVWLVYPLLLVETIGAAFFEPAHSSVIPNIVSENQVLAANTLASITWSFCLAAGASLGGIAAVWLGRDAVFVLNAFSFLLSAWLIRRMSFAEPHAADRPPLRARELVEFTPILDGIRYIRRDPRLFGTVFVKGGLGLLGANNVLLPILGERVFPVKLAGLDHSRAALLGMSMLMGARGAGSLLGPLIGARWAGESHSRLRTGILINLGLGEPPLPLAASCSISPASVMAGEPVTLTVTASNIHKNHTVTYSYLSTGGKAEGKNVTASVDTTGLAPGSYTVTATVTDPKEKREASATCNASFTVQEPPKHPPVISCSANPSTVQSGQPSTITSTGSSPDNRPLTYSFTATGGRITSDGPIATLDTTGAGAGPISINCMVVDDRGLSANAMTSVNVEVPVAAPQASKCGTIEFSRDTRRPWRVDNEAKAILDDCALRLQREPDSKAVVVGNFGADEKNGELLAQRRAVNTKAYLTVEKGIDPARIELRTGNAGTQTADIWIVPAGATFDQAGTQTFDETTVKAGAEQYPGQKPARRAARKPVAPPAQ